MSGRGSGRRLSRIRKAPGAHRGMLVVEALRRLYGKEAA